MLLFGIKVSKGNRRGTKELGAVLVEDVELLGGGVLLEQLARDFPLSG